MTSANDYKKRQLSTSTDYDDLDIDNLYCFEECNRAPQELNSLPNIHENASVIPMMMADQSSQPVNLSYPLTSHSYPNQWAGSRYISPGVSISLNSSYRSCDTLDSSSSSVNSYANDTKDQILNSSPHYKTQSDSDNSILQTPATFICRKKTESEKRRAHNMREQRRSNKISFQIERLRMILAQAGFKVNDSKLDVLIGVEEYINVLKREVESP